MSGLYHENFESIRDRVPKCADCKQPLQDLGRPSAIREVQYFVCWPCDRVWWLKRDESRGM